MSGSYAPSEEWEYEYHSEETEPRSYDEVFLVDLDLTTVNRPIKSVSESRHKRLKDIDKPGAKRRKLTATASKDIAAQDKVNSPQLIDEANSPGSTAPFIDINANGAMKNAVQLLDIPTANPIVSYQGQIYSCNWTDMLGTTLFFSKPQAMSLFEPQISNNEFDLLGTSRIKLVGTAARVTPIEQSTSGKQPDRPGQSLGTIRSSNAKTNADLRTQANFLDQLMIVKKNRGEVDNVRVAMNEKISAAISNGRSMPTQAQRKEIDELNRRVVKGDAAALRRLEELSIASKNDRLPSPHGNPYGVQLSSNASTGLKDRSDLARFYADDAAILPPVESAPVDPQTVHTDTADAAPSSHSLYPELQVPISNPETLNNDNG